MTLVLGASLLIGGILVICLVVLDVRFVLGIIRLVPETIRFVLENRALARHTATKPGEDRPVDPPLLRFGRLMGKEGWTRYSGVYVISAYADGLWVTTGGRDRGIFVSWENIAVTRTWDIFGQGAELDIGAPVTLDVPSYVADALAGLAMNRWPESGPIRVVTWRDVALSLLWFWAVGSLLGAAFLGAFLTLISWLDGRGASLLVPFLFPSIPFGLVCIVLFFIDCRALRSGAARADSRR
ncbi:hypothetical protein JQ580_21315 [Bradyrhizobium japonicum]|uniref:hypothetical protein n=1 Tax=Bradyrhizobium japonicum TaxID=375 RepID=UPI001BAC186F|nr:hypothetical protein [Bradyrhizobium japonicum]MBR0993261.1 hypothetical protein [Bradyrhizobium japonicum]